MTVILGKKTFIATDWAKAYYYNGYAANGLPDKFISDRDLKFTSAFWGELYSLLLISLGFTTAYNTKADGQLERTNQTIIYAL